MNPALQLPIVAKSRTSDWNPEPSEAGNLICAPRDFPAPTPEGLRQHAKRYGPESVQDVADAFGVDLTTSTEARKPKRLTAHKSARATNRARLALVPDEEAA